MVFPTSSTTETAKQIWAAAGVTVSDSSPGCLNALQQPHQPTQTQTDHKAREHIEGPGGLGLVGHVVSNALTFFPSSTNNDERCLTHVYSVPHLS